MLDYVKMATINELNDKGYKTVKILGRLVSIIKGNDGNFFAIETTCKHQGADLLRNYDGGQIVTCPRHQWRYDIESGQCLTNDSPPLRRYGLRLEDKDIFISITPEEVE